MTARHLLIAAGLSGALAVAFGALGTHAIADNVSPERLATWRTGASYHLAHSLALALVALAVRGGWRVSASGVWFLAGIVLFSGSLYARVLFDLPTLAAALAPFGGVSLIIGWLSLGWIAWRDG